MSQTLTQHKYRANFILDTRGYDQPVESLVESISKTLNELEAEILQNGWLTCEATPELLFSDDNAAKWEVALRSLGIDPLLLSAAAGRA